MGDVQINIQNNLGITQAIKQELDEKNYDTSKLNFSVWNQIMDVIKDENANAPSDAKLYSGGSEFINDKKSWRTNFIVKRGAVLKLTETAWNKIVSLVTGKEVETPAVKPPPVITPKPTIEDLAKEPEFKLTDPNPNIDKNNPIKVDENLKKRMAEVDFTKADFVMTPDSETKELKIAHLSLNPKELENKYQTYRNELIDQQKIYKYLLEHNDTEYNDKQKTFMNDYEQEVAHFLEYSDGIKNKQNEDHFAQLKDDNHGKTRTRLINGQEQEYVIFKENGETKRQIINNDGQAEDIIEIADHGKKQFITVSKLQEAIGQKSLPEGITCKCDANGNLTFFKDKQEISAEDLKKQLTETKTDQTPEQTKKEPEIKQQATENQASVKAKKNLSPSNKISEEMQAKIRSIQAVSIGKNCIIDTNGQPLYGKNYNFAHYPIDKTDFAKMDAKIVETKDGKYKKGQIISSNQSILSKKYNINKNQIAVNHGKYLELIKKSETELTDGEKIFIEKHEQIMANLIESGELTVN